MAKTIFKPFWSYDVLKTEEWLASMHAKGYALEKINFALRLFYFTETEPVTYHYRIVYEKKSNGNISATLVNGGFELSCFSKNYYVVKTLEDNPQIVPSYNGFLDKNRKLKFGIGIILLCMGCSAILPAIMIITIMVLTIGALITGNGTIDVSNTEPIQSHSSVADLTTQMGFTLIMVLMFVWLIYSYLKLRSTNKQLEKLCGDKLNLAFTIPKEGLLSKAEEKALKREKKLIRKMRIAWFYAPDKVEIWLGQMENKGYNLYRMGKLGNSFYFFKGEPRKVKYYVDYQNKANPQYFNLNMENGWKLIFTSLSRIQSNHVWSQEYTDLPPLFYSDKESKLRHAKRFALTYSLCFFPICILYIFLIILQVILFKNDFLRYLPILIMYSIIILEFGFFSLRTILYYYRIKKSQEE